MPTVAPTFVQEVYRTATGGSGINQVLTLAVGTTAGNTLVISSKVGSSIVVTSVADSKGNTWRPDYVASAGNSRLSVFSAYLDTALSAGDTITVTLATTMNNCGHRVIELAGVPKTNYLDTGVTTFATTGVSASSLAGGPTPGTLEANELFFTAWVGTNTSSQTVTPSAGWSNSMSAAASQTVNSATQAAGAAGSTVSVTWTESLAQGNQSALILAYRPIPVPSITSVSPTSGSSLGGTSVTITGTNFTGATTVSFGATSASFTVNSATSITATAPAHATGVVDITVATTGGTSSTSAADQFTYTSPSAPTVTSVNPTIGSIAGGTFLTITGTDFTGATNVIFGAFSQPTFTVINSTTITVTSPAHASGTVHVKVTAPGGTSSPTSADQFTYTSAVYTHFTKSDGILNVPSDGGAQVFPLGGGSVLSSSDAGGVLFPDDEGRNL